MPAVAGGVVLTFQVVLPEGLGMSYSAAGLVAMAGTFAMAAGSPWRGRQLDTLGLRRTVVPSIVIELVVWSVAPFVSYPWLLVCAVVGGLMAIPLFTVVRQSLAVLVTSDLRREAFSLDSISVEFSFMSAPLLAVLVATQLSPAIAMIGIGVTTALSGLALLYLNPPLTSEQVARRHPEQAQAIAQQAAVNEPTHATGEGRWGWVSRPLMATLTLAFAAGAVLQGTDVSVVAHLQAADAVALTGVVFLLWSTGSLLGGIAYGAVARPWGMLTLVIAMSLLTMPVGLATHPWMLGLLIVPAGALCAPVITATGERVTRLVAEERRGEAMGWHGGALTMGLGLGGPVAGVFIDTWGPAAGFASVGVLGLLLAVGSWLAAGHGELAVGGVRTEGGETPDSMSA